LARAVDDIGITRTGEIAGTPQYMSPEQAQSEPVDHRADLFSLGSVLYAMCTGRSPFRADNMMAVLRRVCDDTPRPIREINPDTPAWLVEIIEKLLSKNPADRFQSGQEVSDLLSQHLADIQHPASDPRRAVGVSPLVDENQNRSKNQGVDTPRSPWGRLKTVALILVLLFTGVGLTEATGVTKFTATVIRIVTGEGTLVIEVDDPSVTVSIDGEQIRITGAGVEELKLRPGRYKFSASIDGRPIKQELVTITRGGRRVVRVTLEPPDNTVPTPIAERNAFVVFSGTGSYVGKFDTLSDPVTGSTSGDTIEIRGNGPFLTGLIVIDHPLTIRAGDGFRPVIRDDPQHPTVSIFNRLIWAKASLVLEGLDLQTTFSGAYILVSSAPLFAVNCRFFNRKRKDGLLIEESGRLRNCELIAGTLITLAFRSNSELDIENCLTVGHINIRQLDEMGELSLQMRRNTHLPYDDTHSILYLGELRAYESFRTQDTQALKSISIQSSGTVFDSSSVIVRFMQRDNLELRFSPSKAEVWFPRWVSWREQGNLYWTGGKYLELMNKDHSHFSDLANDRTDWNRFWGLEDTGSQEGIIRYQRGDLHAKAWSNPEQLTPEDFRLRPDSAGYRAGPDGKDLGADIDLVGPGKAYERWKKTPAYHAWLIETKAALNNN